MKRIFVAALLAGTAISSAQAADLAARPYTKAPPYIAPIYDWTGFYFGVNAGVGLGRNRADHTVPLNSFDTVYLQPQGIVGGGQVGYNWQTNSSFLGLGPIVFGIEGDIQGSDSRDSRTTLNGLSGITTNFNQRMDWFATARGRVGIVTGSVLSYVTGGYAYGNVRTTATETLGPLVGAATIERGQSGYTLGSGVEAALGGSWTGKIEYLYLDLGNRSTAFTLFGVPQTLNTQTRENIFRAGLNYRIGGNSAYAALPAANWTGFYLGGNFGSGTARDRSSIVSVGLPQPELFNLAPDGILGGVQAGYNWQAANFVFGLEADIQASAQRDNRTCVVSCSLAAAAAFNAKLPYFGTARGRIGYSVGSTLFYATGGYAFGEVKTEVAGINAGVPFATSTSSTRSGYAVGGGIETPFTFLGLFGPQWTSKTEYLYVDLGSTTSTVAAPVASTATTRVQEHIFRTGINYHFNSPVVAKY